MHATDCLAARRRSAQPADSLCDRYPVPVIICGGKSFSHYVEMGTQTPVLIRGPHRRLTPEVNDRHRRIAAELQSGTC